MSENSLTVFTQGTALLAQADTIQKVKELKNLALTAAEWAKRKNMGEEAIQYCRSYALRAEIKLGEMLAATERAKGGQPYQSTATPTQRTEVEPTLKEFGISWKESARAQMLAALPEQKREAIIAGELTTTAARRELRLEKAMQKAPPLPTDKFRIVYADPPWQYSDQLTPDCSIATRWHYPTLSVAELCALPILELTDGNAVLFLWTTSPILEESFAVIRAWGFQYKASFIWDKVKHNFGHYNSVRHEFLLICTRGSCLPDVDQLFDSVQTIERTEHSAKPEWFRTIIDTLYPNGKRIELFARSKHEGWYAWGNEV